MRAGRIGRRGRVNRCKEIPAFIYECAQYSEIHFEQGISVRRRVKLFQCDLRGAIVTGANRCHGALFDGLVARLELVALALNSGDVRFERGKLLPKVFERRACGAREALPVG